MSEVTLSPIDVERPDLDLPTEDGEPMETYQHFLQMSLCLYVILHTWRDRNDFFAGGDMFVYYSLEQAQQVIAELEGTARKRIAFRGPDVFVVLGVERMTDRK